MAGYHVLQIEKGVYGEPSKIREETEEFLDAVQQQNPILALVELSDLMGAIQGYLNTTHPNVDIHDLINMAYLTEKAFKDGTRK